MSRREHLSPGLRRPPWPIMLLVGVAHLGGWLFSQWPFVLAALVVLFLAGVLFEACHPLNRPS